MNTTVGRVRRLTTEGVNEKIRAETEARVAYYANHPEQIENRLRELDEEWDIQRTIETEAAATVLVGLLFGAAFNRKWLVLSVFAGSMLLVHNIHGYYPLLPLFRRLGIRSPQEIAAERYALKAIRGDFERTGSRGEDGSPEPLLEAFQAARA